MRTALRSLTVTEVDLMITTGGVVRRRETPGIASRPTALAVITMTVFLIMTPMVSAVTNPAAKRSRGGCTVPPAPKLGAFRLSEDKKSVEFFCQPDQYLIGSSESSCKNGRWSSQPPICVGVDCEIPTIRDGSLVVMHRGGIVRVECRAGFKLHPNKSSSGILACIDGRWNATKPECISSGKESSEEKKSAKNSNLVGQHPNSGSNQEGDDAKMMMIATTNAMQNDRLQEADYSCVRSDFIVYPPPVPNARPFTRWTIVGGQPRLYTTYQCKWGFMPTSGGDTNVYCQDGKWIGAPPKCKTVVFEEPSHGAFPGITPYLSHEKLLLHADYSCIGAGPRGSVDPPILDNASPVLKFAILEGRPRLYTEYVCNDGFELADKKRAYLYCKGKTWAGEKPKCNPVTSKSCAIGNGGCDQLCSYSNRGQVFCSCKQGFLLQPDKSTCADVDECEVNGANCDHLCNNFVGSFECSCYSGYQLKPDRKSCLKMQDNSKAKKD